MKVSQKAPPKRTARIPIPIRRPSPAPVLRLERPSIQTALKVGPANDPLEHEADVMADRVTTMSAPSLDAAPQPNDPPNDVMAQREMPAQDSQPNTDEFESAPDIPADHQDPDIPTTEDVDTANVEEDEFAEIEAGEPASPNDLLRDAAPAAVGREGGDAPSDVTRAVAQPGAGRPLPDGVRAFMEPRFGVSFSDVRIHDQPADRRTAARIGARAFAHRNHIWMGEGESVDNRRLMAHELTHVVQQTKRDPAPGAARAEEVTQTDEAAPVRRGWAADKAESYARDVPGYTLLTVILGKSPITGRRVSRNATNLIGGFLGLIPGGNALFEKLQETRALERAYEWVKTRLSELNLSWSRITGLIDDFIDEMPAWDPLEEAKKIFRPLVNDVITFAKDIKDKVLEFIVRGALALAGPYGEKIWGVIEKARDTISTIIADPLGFAKNLVAAIVGGFKQFGANILGHVKAGLMGWLFGTMAGAGIELPDKLDFKGIVSIALQILGLTYANFRAILVKKLGKKGEEKVAFLEKSVEVVKILLTEGFLGVWQRLLEMIDNFKQTVIDGIRDFVINTIVMGAISWIAGLSNPIGGVVKICLSIYNMIVAFIERLDQIMDVANSIFSSIGAIAKGKTKDAANFIEKTIAGTIPIFLAFVSALIPVTGITKTIKNIIKKLQAPVKKAMEKFAGFLVKKAKKLFSKLLGKVNDKRKLPESKFKVGKAPHTIKPKKKGGKFEISIASKEKKKDASTKDVDNEHKKAVKNGDDSKPGKKFADTYDKTLDEAEKKANAVKADQQKAPTAKQSKEAAKAGDDAAKAISKASAPLNDSLFYDTAPEDGAIIRAIEPRIPKIEGEVDTYTKRGAETKKVIDSEGKKSQLGPEGLRRLSFYYENDHIVQKGLSIRAHEYVRDTLQPELEAGTRADDAEPGPKLGTIGTHKPGASGEHLPAITTYRPLHRQKSKSDEGAKGLDKIIDNAKGEGSANERVAKLQEGALFRMEEEQKATAANYSSDKNASEKIRGAVRKGLKKLSAENAALYGFTPGKPPVVKRGGAGGDVNLAMDADPALGTPDFDTLEGALKKHSEGLSLKVGNWMEFDHVVESSLAEGARDLTVGLTGITPALKGVDIPGEVRAATEERIKGLKLKSEDANARREAAKTRLDAAFASKIFDNPAAQDYTSGDAGTVALYRPVHRAVTIRQQGEGVIGKPIIRKDEAAAIKAPLVEYAAFKNEDAEKLKGVKDSLSQAAISRFVPALDAHVQYIKDEYGVEMTNFKKINRSEAAHARMQAIVDRASSTVDGLRAKTVNIVGGG